VKPFPFRITGVASRLGEVRTIEAWADKVAVPHRFREGERLTGADIQRILGIRSKSWDPALFKDPDTVRQVAKRALDSAALQPSSIDLAIVVTCTPYEVMLDQDAFRFLRGLGLADDVVPLQLSAGCAGILRAAAVAARTSAQRVLVVSYNLTSLFAMVDEETPSPVYLNPRHPHGEMLWVAPAIFSDAAAALVLERDPESQGRFVYSRDSLSFGGGPGIASPLVTFEGGGALHPPGSPDATERSCFVMQGEEVRNYYVRGMMLNHEALLAERPRYAEEVRRIYVHQASPALIRTFVEQARLEPTHVAMKADVYGNLVAASTVRLLHEDLAERRLRPHDEVCISVVGAGPERGVVTCRVTPREVVAA
jgi:3-oxoacyl-[acyl-carrier-protein] synthase III